MGLELAKRSDFERIERDYYPTPMDAARPLVDVIFPDATGTIHYCEPCAGDGRLADHLSKLSSGRLQLAAAFDIDPQPSICDIVRKDALEIGEEDLNGAEWIITNPPWDRRKSSGYLLHSMIAHFAEMRPTALLFDADWMHTKQAAPLCERYLTKIVSIGRVKWIENSTMTGKDNCAWFIFDKGARQRSEVPAFYSRGWTPQAHPAP
jgi:hypothetical protein